MAGLVVLLIILGCGAFQFFKGSIFKAVMTIIVAIIACAVAFGFFEWAASWLIGKISNSKYHPWVQPVCFIMLFVLAFAILQTAAMQLGKKQVDFGDLPEHIGRPILGIFLGLIISGFLLTALAMAPLPNEYPYQRFDARNPDAQRSTKVLLNVDGFVSGWFGILSKGSLSAIRNPQSFSALHPDFLDQLYLNRHNDSDEISLVTKAGAISVPSKEGVWYASAGLKDSEGNAITPRTGCRLMVVRVVILKNYIKTSGKFTLGQLRLICIKGFTQGDMTGDGVNEYSIGYYSGQDEITTKRLSELITVVRDDFKESETKRNIDFVFNVPNDYTPVTLQFKQNCIYQVSRAVSSEQAPAVTPFVVEESKAGPGPSTPDTTPSSGDSNATPSDQGASKDSSKGGGMSPVGRMLTGGVTDEDLNQ